MTRPVSVTVAYLCSSGPSQNKCSSVDAAVRRVRRRASGLGLENDPPAGPFIPGTCYVALLSNAEGVMEPVFCYRPLCCAVSCVIPRFLSCSEETVS